MKYDQLTYSPEERQEYMAELRLWASFFDTPEVVEEFSERLAVLPIPIGRRAAIYEVARAVFERDGVYYQQPKSQRSWCRLLCATKSTSSNRRSRGLPKKRFMKS